MPDRVAHASDLSIATLVDGQLEDRGSHERRVCRSGRAVVEFDALTELAKFGTGGRTLEVCDVLRTKDA